MRCAAMPQAGVAAETYSNSPGLLRRVLAELLQHTLATFSTILAEQLPGALRFAHMPGQCMHAALRCSPRQCPVAATCCKGSALLSVSRCLRMSS